MCETSPIRKCSTIAITCGSNQASSNSLDERSRLDHFLQAWGLFPQESWVLRRGVENGAGLEQLKLPF